MRAAIKTGRVRADWGMWCNYCRLPSLWSQECESNESCLRTNRRNLINCRHAINVLPYFSGAFMHRGDDITGFFSYNCKDVAPSRQPYFFALRRSLLFPPAAPSPQTLCESQRRSCWKGAPSPLIQPSVRAQFCIHCCHILILSLGSASGRPVKETTVWRVGREWIWCTQIHWEIEAQTLQHLLSGPKRSFHTSKFT